MARLRYNGLTATLGADLLTAGTTITFSSALTSAAGAVPTITGGDYIPLAVLDADGGVLEIIHLTAYMSGATTGTVSRAQESTTAADHAAGFRVVNGVTVADITAPAMVGVQAITAATVTVPTATATILPLAAEAYDTHAFHSTSTNNSRFTIPAGMGGYYALFGYIRYAANATGERGVRFFKNGTLIASGGLSAVAAVTGGGITIVSHSSVFLLAAGDYVELAAYQTSGGNLDIPGDWGVFTMARLGT